MCVASICVRRAAGTTPRIFSSARSAAADSEGLPQAPTMRAPITKASSSSPSNMMGGMS